MAPPPLFLENFRALAAARCCARAQAYFETDLEKSLVRAKSGKWSTKIFLTCSMYSMEATSREGRVPHDARRREAPDIGGGGQGAGDVRKRTNRILCDADSRCTRPSRADSKGTGTSAGADSGLCGLGAAGSRVSSISRLQVCCSWVRCCLAAGSAVPRSSRRLMTPVPCSQRSRRSSQRRTRRPHSRCVHQVTLCDRFLKPTPRHASSSEPSVGSVSIWKVVPIWKAAARGVWGRERWRRRGRRRLQRD